jgi:hypothetical protein
VFGPPTFEFDVFVPEERNTLLHRSENLKKKTATFQFVQSSGRKGRKVRVEKILPWLKSAISETEGSVRNCCTRPLDYGSSAGQGHKGSQFHLPVRICSLCEVTSISTCRSVYCITKRNDNKLLYQHSTFYTRNALTQLNYCPSNTKWRRILCNQSERKKLVVDDLPKQESH